LDLVDAGDVEVDGVAAGGLVGRLDGRAEGDGAAGVLDRAVGVDAGGDARSCRVLT
jgi:hypothetical protein